MIDHSKRVINMRASTRDRVLDDLNVFEELNLLKPYCKTS